MADKENQSESYKVQETLKGSSNYRTWRFAMKTSLEARDLWDIVIGDEVKPEADKAGIAWEKRSKKAMATIVLGMSAAEQEHVIDCQTPKAAWDILEKLYGGKGRNRKFMLLQELFRMSMGSSMDGYLRAIKEKMSELSAIGTKLERDIKLAIVLNGLTESYRYLVVAMESQLDTIDFDDLTARLLEEERKLVGGNGGSNGADGAMVSYTKDTDITSVWKDGRLQMACYYCGQSGHMKRDCAVRKFRMRVADEREKERRERESGGKGKSSEHHAGMAIVQDDSQEESNKVVTIW